MKVEDRRLRVEDRAAILDAIFYPHFFHHHILDPPSSVFDLLPLAAAFFSLRIDMLILTP
jgi:hypothetical protein